MKTHVWADLLKKLALAAIAFGIAFYFIFLFKEWAGRQQSYFSFIEDWQSLALVIIIGITTVKVLEWLLKLELHVLFSPKRKVKR